MAKYSATIMCGHGTQTNGKWDSGATYNGKQEAKLMFPITKAFVKYARASGITVYSDVDTNNDKNVVTGVALANKKNTDVFVSIHCDWYKAPTGTLPLYCKGSEKGKKLAQCLNTYVKEMTGIKTRGISARTDLGELNNTNMPACIFEAGSIKADQKEWDTEKECDEYGKALAKGLCKYFGITFKDGSTPKKTTTTSTTKKNTSSDDFLVKVTATALNIRSGAGTKYDVVGVIKDKGIYTIVETKGDWGKLKSGKGWIHLDYTKKVKA